MKSKPSKEQIFIDEVDRFDFIKRDMGVSVQAMERWLTQLESELKGAPLASTGMQAHHPLAETADAVNAAVAAACPAWAQQWRRLEPAQALANAFDDKLVLLVFGKFNTGKSSFCNFLADRFRSFGKTAEHFHIEAGRIAETDARLKEGVSETTSSLQGVRLAGKLVLVDTPGLHSTTPENAALTQLFTDSADAVLWLTSSTSPGQVLELDELGRELRRNKPLLPVLTRSDFYDEDELDGEICKFLRNKSATNRKLQENDVKDRAAAKLALMGLTPVSLKMPVSISTLMASKDGGNKSAMDEAGFERLYAELAAIARPALSYKRRKLAEIFLHHLEESVLGSWNSAIAPLVRRLHLLSAATMNSLEQRESALANAMWRVLIPQLPALLDAYAISRERQTLLAGLSHAVQESYVHEIGLQLQEYQIDTDVIHNEIDNEVEETLSAALEHCVGGEEKVQDLAEIHFQDLYKRLTEAVRALALRLSEDVIARCREAIGQLDKLALRLEDVVDARDAQLKEIAAELRLQLG